MELADPTAPPAPGQPPDPHSTPPGAGEVPQIYRPPVGPDGRMETTFLHRRPAEALPRLPEYYQDSKTARGSARLIRVFCIVLAVAGLVLLVGFLIAYILEKLKE